MMNKLLTKLVNKKSAVLILAVTVVLLAAAIIVSVLCGVNYGAGMEDGKTVTVTVNSFVYENERDALEETCESVFEEQDVNVKYVYRAGEYMTGDTRDIAYVFDSSVEDSKLAEVKTALKTKLDEEAAKSENESALGGAIVSVAWNSEEVLSEITSAYLWRSVIAVGVFAVLAFVYVAIRFRLGMGFVALITPIVSAALTASIVLLTRIPMTNTIFYAVLVASLVASVFMVMLLGKIRENASTDAFAKADAETLVKGSLAHKWVGWTTVALAVALVLVGAIATTAVRYFAIASLVGLLIAAFVGLAFVPAAVLGVQTRADSKAADTNASGYVGAKKEEKAENADEE